MTAWKICICAAVSLPSAAPAQDATVARNLAATCATCHAGHGQARGELPSLQGLAGDGIVTAMADFKSGARPATVMQQIAKGYTDEQIKLVAGFFAAQLPRK